MRTPSVKIKLPTIDYHALTVRMFDRRWTKQALAKAIGVTPQAFGQWINRGELMHGSVVWAIADRLEIPVNEIPNYFYQTGGKAS